MSRLLLERQDVHALRQGFAKGDQNACGWIGVWVLRDLLQRAQAVSRLWADELEAVPKRDKGVFRAGGVRALPKKREYHLRWMRKKSPSSLDSR
jgi:hypothetical protein